jgi:hypothetical protein
MSAIAIVAVAVGALIVLAVLIALATDLSQRRELRNLARETEVL